MAIRKKTWAIRLVSLLVLGLMWLPQQVWAITIQQEVDLGKKFMVDVRQQYKLVNDPYINQYINALGHRLLKYYPSPPPFTFHFYVVDQEVYNAFAGPAAHIFINSGLMAATDNESELAGVLCHEIAHAVCRHISKNISQAGKIQLGTLAGVLAGILLGATGSDQASGAVAISSLAAGQSISLAYSREDEQQADEVGAKALMAAGYSVNGMIDILKKIQEKDYYGSDVPNYLQDHPGVNDRIIYLSRDLDDEKDNPASVKKRPETAFHLAHTRVMALYGDKTKAKAWFEADARKHPESYLPAYGLGLLTMREDHLAEAKAYFEKALEKQALNSYVLADLGKDYYLEGDYGSARKVLASAVETDPKNLEGRLFLGKTLFEQKNYPRALDVFERLLADAPDYSRVLYCIGETYDREGQTAEAHYHLGLYYLQTKDFRKAVFNLKRARRETRDKGLIKKINDALREVQRSGKKKKGKESGRDNRQGPGGRYRFGWTP